MAKTERQKAGKKGKQDIALPLKRENFIIIGIGILFIVAGYTALSGNAVNGFSQLTVAPILLLIGYIVVIPFGIMYRKKVKESPSDSLAAPNKQPQQVFSAETKKG